MTGWTLVDSLAENLCFRASLCGLSFSLHPCSSFPSLENSFTWHLQMLYLFFHFLLFFDGISLSPVSPWTSLQIPHLGWTIETLLGRFHFPSFLPHPMSFCSYFFFLSFLSSMPCLQAALGAALTIRIRNLEAIRLLVNLDKLMTILKRGTTWLDLCFRELHLHVKEGELYWRESEGRKTR